MQLGGYDVYPGQGNPATLPSFKLKLTCRSPPAFTGRFTVQTNLLGYDFAKDQGLWIQLVWDLGMPADKPPNYVNFSGSGCPATVNDYIYGPSPKWAVQPQFGASDVFSPQDKLSAQDFYDGKASIVLEWDGATLTSKWVDSQGDVVVAFPQVVDGALPMLFALEVVGNNFGGGSPASVNFSSADFLLEVASDQPVRLWQLYGQGGSPLIWGTYSRNGDTRPLAWLNATGEQSNLYANVLSVSPTALALQYSPKSEPPPPATPFVGSNPTQGAIEGIPAVSVTWNYLGLSPSQPVLLFCVLYDPADQVVDVLSQTRAFQPQEAYTATYGSSLSPGSYKAKFFVEDAQENGLSADVVFPFSV